MAFFADTLGASSASALNNATDISLNYDDNDDNYNNNSSSLENDIKDMEDARAPLEDDAYACKACLIHSILQTNKHNSLVEFAQLQDPCGNILAMF
jgi:hypothetical protein